MELYQTIPHVRPLYFCNNATVNKAFGLISRISPLTARLQVPKIPVYNQVLVTHSALPAYYPTAKTDYQFIEYFALNNGLYRIHCQPCTNLPT